MSLLLPQIEELDALMRRMAELVDAVEREDPQAQVQTREWLGQLERAFERNRLACEGAAIAALRAELRMVALGALPPDLELAGTLRSRRLREVALLDALRRAERIVSGALASTRVAHEEAERVMRQLVAIARHKQLPSVGAEAPTDELGLRAVWQALCSDADLANGTARVLGLVAQADALAMLDRALSSG